MVFGNIRDIKDYGFLEKEVLKCFEYAKNHDLLAFEKGSHEIEGDNLFVNIVAASTDGGAPIKDGERLFGYSGGI